ncbi:MAG TPA: hypothetical protein VJ890_09930 [Vineibacter sp.]|nr:hypothetical protein [Vineibacter sp.]
MAGKPGFRARSALGAAILLVGVVVVALVGGAGGWLGSSTSTRDGEVPQARTGGPQVEARGQQSKAWGPSVGFANRDRLDEHYRKHGSEFGDISRQDYLRQAQALRDAPAGGDVLQAVRRDGVVTRFDRRSGAFLAFNADGVIRTFFRPNDGERYFRRQLERDR